MYAVEFTAKIKDGIIELPKKFRDKVTDSVKVIILKEEPAATSEKVSGRDIIDKLLTKPLHVKGFRPLKRDEIYER